MKHFDNSGQIQIVHFPTNCSKSAGDPMSYQSPMVILVAAIITRGRLNMTLNPPIQNHKQSRLGAHWHKYLSLTKCHEKTKRLLRADMNHIAYKQFNKHFVHS